MVQFRRNYIPGGSYFFTVALRDRRSDLLTRYIDDLRQAFVLTRTESPFRLDAVVILPDHLHAIWSLPPSDSDYPGRWRAIKSRYIRSLAKAGLPIPRNARGEAAVWQRRFWEHTLRDEADFARHVDSSISTPSNMASRAAPPNGLIRPFTDSSIAAPLRLIGADPLVMTFCRRRESPCEGSLDSAALHPGYFVVYA